MVEKRKYVGTWWLPESPDKRVGGVLTVKPSGICELQLTGSLLANPLWTQNVDDGGPEIEAKEVVHGEAASEEFTILHAQVIGGGVGLPFVDQTQILLPQVVLRGRHLAYADERVFAAAEIELDNLTAWSSLSGFSSTINTEAMRGASDDYWVRYQLARPAARNDKGFLEGFEVELKWQSTFNPHVTETHASRQLKASERVQANFKSRAPASWDQFIEVTKRFQDLLTFATRHPCAIRSCHLILAGEGGQASGRIELIRRAFVKPKRDAEDRRSRFLFRRSDVSFQELLDKWDRLHSEIGLGIHVLLGLDYKRGGYIENRIINATSAAESIHRALFPKATGLPPEEHQALLEKVREAVAGNEKKQWILGRLGNHPGFVDRMHQLAEVPAEVAVRALLEDTNQWAKWLRDARNAVAHLEGNDLEKIPEGARYEIPAVTLALLHLVFLAELGLPPEIQLNAVNAVYGGQTERFRHAVKTKLA